MLLKDIKNISTIQIVVKSNLEEQQQQDGQHYRVEAIKALHNAIYETVEELITPDKLQERIIAKINNYEQLPNKLKDLTTLGSINISIRQQQLIVKQRQTDEATLKALQEKGDYIIWDQEDYDRVK